MNAEKKKLSDLQKIDCKTAPYQGRVYRKARRGIGSSRVLGVADEGCEAHEYAYHVMSRTAGGEFLLGKEEKEGLRKLIWKMAQFCGVKVLTYCVMDNHFHILVRVRNKERFNQKFHGEQGEEELLKHLSLLYSKEFITRLRKEIDWMRGMEQEAEITEMLDQFRERFCDLSVYMKEVKERFTRWYNKKHGRAGTLWQGRFKSVLVEDGNALRTMSSYIDLNPVRAGIVTDPKNYRWCAYAEAVAGSKRAGRGLCDVLDVPTDTFANKQNLYRCWLFENGTEVKVDAGNESRQVKSRKGIKEEIADKVIALDGKLSRYELLRSKVKYFSEGVVIGSQSFVAAQRRRILEKTGFSANEIEAKLKRGRRKEPLSEKSLVTWRW
ncbi:MAG: transposase [Akkermansiaceae bacterium]